MITFVLDSRQLLALLEAVAYVQKFSQRKLFALYDFDEVTEGEAQVASTKSVSCASAPSISNAASGLIQLANEGLLARIPDRFGWYPSENCPVVVYQVSDAGLGYLRGLTEAEGIRQPAVLPPLPPTYRLQVPDYFKYDVLQVTKGKSRKVYRFDVFWCQADLTKFPTLSPAEFWTWLGEIAAYSWTAASCKCGKPLSVSLSPHWVLFTCKNCNLWMIWKPAPEKNATVRIVL